MTLKLTPPQVQATLPNLSTFVDAGAGSGKTSVLIQRYIQILDQYPEIEPRHIAVITFTKDAAIELKERLSAQISNGQLSPFTQKKLVDGLAFAHISTIHSFCADLIRQFAHPLSIDPQFSILETADSIYLIREAIANTLRDAAASRHASLYECLSYVSHFSLNTHLTWLLHHGDAAISYHSHVSQPSDDPHIFYFHHLYTLGQLANNHLSNLKTQQSALFFDDLIPLALSALQIPECLAIAQQDIRHLMIDEFQDTDPKQWDLIKLLSDPFTYSNKKSLCVVGDVKQSIYRFRNADAAQFLDVLTHFQAQPHTQVVSLADNFRTSRPVLAAINTIFKSIFESEPDFIIPYTALHASRDDSGTVTLVQFSEDEDPQHEFYAMLKWIQLMRHQNPKLQYSDFGILFRRTQKFKFLEQLFSQAGIPVSFSHQQGLFQKETSIDLYQCITSLMQPYDPLSWIRVITSPIFGLTHDHIFWLRTMYPTLLPYEAFLSLLNTPHSPEIPTNIGEELKHVALKATQWVSHVPFQSLPSILRTIVDDVGFRNHFSSDEHQDIEHFLTIIDSLFSECHGDYALFSDRLRQLMRLTESKTPVETNPIDAVHVMTIHASKGLEFPVVLIGECGKDMIGQQTRHVVSNKKGIVFPLSSQEKSASTEGILDYETAQSIQEYKRLFYVACTRARDHLAFFGTHPKSKKSEKQTLSFFDFVIPHLSFDNSKAYFHSTVFNPNPITVYNNLNELPSVPNNPAFITQPLFEQPLTPPLSSSINLHTPEKKRLLKLSVSQAEAGLTCVKKVLHFPLIQALASSSTFKLENPLISDAMHGATVGIHVHTAFYEANTQPTLEAMHIIQKMPQLSANDIPFVLEAIASFKQSSLFEKTSSSEAYHEYPFQILLQELILDGRIDTAVVIDGLWHVIDYKTDAVTIETYKTYSQKYYYQLAIYAVALDLCFKIQDDIVGLLYFTQCQKTISFQFTKHMRQEIISQLQQIPRSLFLNQFNRTDPSVCASCPYFFIDKTCPGVQ